MIFDHKVKHNGITYPAGADVPIEEVKPVVKENPVVAEEKPAEPKPAKTKTGGRKAKK